MVPALRALGAEYVELDIGRKSPLALRHVATLRRLFARERVDIVHARSRVPAWLARFALRGRGAGAPRFVTTVHGPHSPSRYSAVMASGDRVICVSQTVRDYVARHYPHVDPARLRVIPRGIDPQRFPAAPMPDPAARAEVAALHPALAGNGPLLLLPGRGTRLKGHADALVLLAALRRRGLDARLWMPGARDANRNAYVAELEARAASLGVDGQLAITPPTDAIARAYAASDLVLQLSHKPEAFGRTVLEALCVGRPVLGWDHGGVGEQLRASWPDGAVTAFDTGALLDRAQELLTRRAAPAVTRPDTLRAMQEATLSLYDELVRNR